MSESKFSVGDTVYLISGSPKMTVTDVTEQSTYRGGGYVIETKWFVGQKINMTRADQNAFVKDDPNPKKGQAEKK